MSLISAENQTLISFYLYIKLTNTKSTMKGPIPSTNQTNLVCKTPGDFTKHTANDMSPLPYNIGDNVIFLFIFIVFTPQE